MSMGRRALRTDGEATYTRILETAGELFAQSGFAETTNKAIAARAEVDLASINYHFGSRGGLYEAVLKAAHGGLVDTEALRVLGEADLPARDKLRRLIEALVDGATADGDWRARVLAREILSPSSHLQTILQGAMVEKLPTLLGVLGQITGIAPGDPALLRCAVSVMAPCAMLLVVGRNASPFAQNIRDMPRADLVEHLYGFAIGGLEAVGRSRRGA